MPGPFYFAWCGGLIQEPQTVITNGNTHGGVVETVIVVGSIESGSAVLSSIASSTSLEDAALYTISGPGLADGTFFVHDNSTLTEPNSINLSEPADATLNGAIYAATKSILIGSTSAAMSSGSNVITLLDDLGLLPGLYCVSGTGIGNTASPEGGFLAVSSAYVEYGGGGVMTMYILGPGGPQPVTAASTGAYSIRITGMPDVDWYTITGIPAGALSGLTAGSRYNIAGNGVQVGSTFVAGGSGAEIVLDLPAESSTVNALLTITGPRTPDAGFDPDVHNREDEQIVGLEIAQEEGGLATLTIDVKNPNVGLLALGRNLWCWLSWDQAWSPEGGGVSPDLVPLFNGRLIGVPKLSVGEIVQLQFLARPDDFNEQKLALNSVLAVLPYYDPIWLAANTNPDTVLETYSTLWHVDRTTLALTTSDILAGEDGTITIGEDGAFYDSFSLSYGSAPLTAVTVSGTVSWSQQGSGTLDVTDTLVRAFHDAGSPYRAVFGLNKSRANWVKFGYTRISGGGLIQVVCGDGLRTDWPKPGTSIGGGWSLSSDNEGEGKPLCYCIDADRPNGWLEALDYKVSYTMQEALTRKDLTEEQMNVALLTSPYINVLVKFPMNNYKIRMVLNWTADRPRTETVTAVMVANVQRELSDSADSDSEDIALTSTYVAQPVDVGGAIPIGAASRKSYFQTNRGGLSLEYLLLAARARMRARARAVDITFAVPWATAIGITLRHSVNYLDRRLPGGSATGKVKSYTLTVGDGGMFGEFTIGCSIGEGDPSTAAAGLPSYVDSGYVEPGYQVISGEQQMLLDAELAYQTLDDFVVDDDGLDLTNITLSAINECVVINGMENQLAKLSTYQLLINPSGDPITELATLSTAVTLDLKPVSGNGFHTGFFPAVSRLSLPKTIDLAAASG